MSSEIAEAVAAMIEERRKAREADYARRRQSEAEFRVDHQERREHGLRKRYRIKEARIQARPSIT